MNMGCKISVLSEKCFRSYSNRQQEEQNNPFVQCLYGKNYRHLFNWTTELGLETFNSP